MKVTSTPNAPAAIGPYSQAVAVNGFLFTSGQIALVPETGEIAGDTIAVQATRCCENLKAVLEANGLGFEDVAEKIMKYDEVESVYLMSGVYDLNVVVKAKTLQDIARFVSRELATIDSVTSTTTHFVLRRYKEMDVELVSEEDDGRGQLFI